MREIAVKILRSSPHKASGEYQNETIVVVISGMCCIEGQRFGPRGLPQVLQNTALFFEDSYGLAVVGVFFPCLASEIAE